MSTLLQSINLFPESRIWRIRKKPEVSHNCGGILTLIVILTLITVLALEMRAVFNKQRSTVKEEKHFVTGSYKTIFTTNMSSTSSRPSMFAMVDWKGLRGFVDPIYKIKGTYFNGTHKQDILMERCTRAHFLNLGVPAAIKQYENSSMCFPLNKSFQIQYEYLNGGNKKYIYFTAVCNSTSGCKPYGTPFIFLQNQVNPLDKDSFWIPYHTGYYPDVSNNLKVYQLRIGQYFMQEDSSVLPFQEKNKTEKGFFMEEVFLAGQEPVSGGIPMIQVVLNFSSKRYKYLVSYYKVIDALSYVGGLFNIMYAMCFFLNHYGEMVFEFLFAQLYFRSTTAKKFHPFSYLKSLAYKGLSYFNFRPNWRLAQQRQRLRDNVNILLDVTYLQKRIQFLQKAIEVMMQEHQLKGLRLIHRYSQDQVEQKYDSHLFRDKFMKYFRKKGAVQLLQSQKRLKASGVSSMGSSSNFAQINLMTKTVYESAKNLKSVEMEPQQESEAPDNKIQEQLEDDWEIDEIQAIDEEILAKEVEQEIGNNISKLVQQSMNPLGSYVSRNIVSKIDKKIVKWIKRKVKSGQFCGKR